MSRLRCGCSKSSLTIPQSNLIVPQPRGETGPSFLQGSRACFFCLQTCPSTQHYRQIRDERRGSQRGQGIQYLLQEGISDPTLRTERVAKRPRFLGWRSHILLQTLPPTREQAWALGQGSLRNLNACGMCHWGQASRSTPSRFRHKNSFSLEAFLMSFKDLKNKGITRLSN